MARVLLFGRLADIAGWREREIDLSTVDALRRALCEADPGLAEALGAPGVQVAVDQEIVRGDRPVFARTEVAFLPAMSGG